MVAGRSLEQSLSHIRLVQGPFITALGLAPPEPGAAEWGSLFVPRQSRCASICGTGLRLANSPPRGIHLLAPVRFCADSAVQIYVEEVAANARDLLTNLLIRVFVCHAAPQTSRRKAILFTPRIGDELHRN